MTLPHPIRIRPASLNDAEFAYDALEQTMRVYVEATWGQWPQERCRVEMTNAASCGQLEIIELAAERMGLLRVEAFHSHFQIEQLSVVPRYQRQGIGTLIVERVVKQARAVHLPVRLRVLRVNPARAMYERNGFKVVAETSERYFMERAL